MKRLDRFFSNLMVACAGVCAYTMGIENWRDFELYAICTAIFFAAGVVNHVVIIIRQTHINHE